jgi:hypothetical protein
LKVDPAMRVIACNSSYGKGGIGQHFAQLVEESRARGRLGRYYAPGLKTGPRLLDQLRKVLADAPFAV